MLYVAYISFLFLLLQLGNALLNLLFRQKIHRLSTTNKEIISILIPARNEEENIVLLLKSLQKIKGDRIEILVFDDHSTDNTAQYVRSFTKQDPRVRLIQSGDLPEGWLGKNHACYQLARHAKGACYLFIDADVLLSGTIIDDTVAYLQHYKLGLLSVFPIQIQKSWGEKLLVPIMNYILLTLLPLVFVRISPFKSHAAANGQFMLFNTSVYNAMQPHKLFKNTITEDIAIARFMKKENINMACITGDNRVKCRMYKSYSEAVNGFSKNVFMFFGNSFFMAISFWVFATLGFIPVIYSLPAYAYWYFLGIVLIQLSYSLASKQNAIVNTFLLPLHLFSLLIIIVNGIISKTQKKYLWKGRSVYS